MTPRKQAATKPAPVVDAPEVDEPQAVDPVPEVDPGPGPQDARTLVRRGGDA